MIQQQTPNRTPSHRAPAMRCANCQRELPTGEGEYVEFIGVLGPECVKRYASLRAALAQVNGLEALEEDQGTIVLAHHVVRHLRRIGVAVKVVDVRPGVKAVQIVGMSSKPSCVVKSWAQTRAEFEARLKQAAAEREAGVAA